MKFYTPFNLPSDWNKTSVLTCLDPSLTVQADKEQSDINTIVRQFGLTKQLPYGNSVPEYADYLDIPNDYHAAVEFLRDSSSQFLELPASTRSRFDNDPGKFLEFVMNDSNYDEAVSLGVVFDNRPKPEPSVLASDDSTSVSASGTLST